MERAITWKYDKIGAGDLNNDGKTDVILYGRKEPGIAVFLGEGTAPLRNRRYFFPTLFSRLSKSRCERR